MKPLQAGMKLTKILGKPIQLFFGSDEKGFITLTAASILTYFSGFPDAAIIFAVYSTLFAYSTMQDMHNSTSSEEDTPFDEEKMMNIMGQAGEALDEIQNEEKEEEEDK